MIKYTVYGTNQDSAMHSGIKDQKWHNRRYQNPDGTYTEEGLARKRAAYANTRAAIKLLASNRDAANKIADNYVNSTKHKIRTDNTDYKSLSYKELEDLVKRQDLEKRYLSNVTKEVTDDGAERIKAIVGIVGGSLVALNTAFDLYEKIKGSKQ